MKHKTLLFVMLFTMLFPSFSAVGSNFEHEAYLINLLGEEALYERAKSTLYRRSGAISESDSPSAEFYLKDTYLQKIIDAAMISVPQITKAQLHFIDGKVVIDAALNILLDEAMDISLEIPFTLEAKLAVAGGAKQNRVNMDILTLKVWEGNLPAKTLIEVGLKMMNKAPEIKKYLNAELERNEVPGSLARVLLDIKLEEILDLVGNSPQVKCQSCSHIVIPGSEKRIALPNIKIGFVSCRKGMFGMSLY